MVPMVPMVPHGAGTIGAAALQSGIQHLAGGTMDHPGLNASRFMTIVSISSEAWLAPHCHSRP